MPIVDADRVDLGGEVVAQLWGARERESTGRKRQSAHVACNPARSTRVRTGARIGEGNVKQGRVEMGARDVLRLQITAHLAPLRIRNCGCQLDQSVVQRVETAKVRKRKTNAVRKQKAESQKCNSRKPDQKKRKQTEKTDPRR